MSLTAQGGTLVPESEGEAEPEAEGEVEPEAEGEAEAEDETAEPSSMVADVILSVVDFVAAIEAEDVDAEAGAELKDLFMSTWGDKPVEGEITLSELKYIYGIAPPAPVTEAGAEALGKGRA